LVTNSRQLFLQALKDEYNAQFELSNALEGKSGRLITVCGIFIPLLFGFSSSLIEKANSNPNVESFLTILLVISLSIAVASIFFSLLALRIKPYSHAFLPDDFFDKDTGILDKEEVKKYGDKDEQEIYDEMIEDYLESNKHNKEVNHNKAYNIKISQYLFLISLGIVPVLVTVFFYSIW
jgi:hypothetical protein